MNSHIGLEIRSRLFLEAAVGNFRQGTDIGSKSNLGNLLQNTWNLAGLALRRQVSRSPFWYADMNNNLPHVT
jgi:hypothetical protein